MELRPHPAKYTDGIIRAMANAVAPGSLVLDPMAGVGRIHLLAGLVPDVRTVGVELEPEWAGHHLQTLVGNALCLPFADATFDVVAVSPTYGNRLADHHEAKDACKTCGGSGWPAGAEAGCAEAPTSCPECGHWSCTCGGLAGAIGAHASRCATCRPCKNCGGSGLSARNTYRHKLGRMPHADSSTVMAWGPAYWQFHEKAWAEAARVMKPAARFVVNLKNPVDGDGAVRYDLVGFHAMLLSRLGFDYRRLEPVAVRGYRNGANRAQRAAHETVMVFDR